MTFSSSPTRRKAAIGATLALAILGGASAIAQTPPPAAAPAPEAAAPAQPPATVLATIDGTPITAGEVALAAEDLSQSLASMTEPQRRDYALNYLIDMKIAARAAEKANLGGGEEFNKRLAYLKDRALMEELLQNEAKTAATDEAMRKLYEDTAKNLKPETEVRASHILVEKEEDAKKVVERLNKGEDFAKIANEVSKDPGSGKQGGDLGFFGKDQMVPQFAEVAFKLEPGKLSEPVKTQFGWHIIKVAEKRERAVPPFEQVKPQIESYVVRTAQQDLILKLRAAAKVERTEAGKPSEPPAGGEGLPGGAPAPEGAVPPAPPAPQ